MSTMNSKIRLLIKLNEFIKNYENAIKSKHILKLLHHVPSIKKIIINKIN